MRRRSLAGPLVLLLAGGFFLWNNLHPEFPVFATLARYWPFLLVAWGAIRLLEVVFWRQEARGGSFSGGEIALIVLLCFAGFGFWQANRHGVRFKSGGLDMFGEQYDYAVSARGPAAGIRRIVIENPRGNVRVTGGDGQEVTVSGRKTIRAYSRRDADRTHQNTQVEVVAQGDRILIRTNQERAPTNQRVSHDLEVTAPREVMVESRNKSGDVDVTGVTGDVEISSERADVRLNHIGGNARVDLARSDVIRAIEVKGAVNLQGRGSDVELENISGQVSINGSYSGTLEFKGLARPLHFESRNTELRVEAIPGRISMDLGEFNARNLVGPVRLVTRSRDIRIEDFTLSLEVETERGDIDLVPARLPVAKIEARSRTGRIDLTLPDKATFQIEATADRGDAINEFGPAIERESEGRSATLKGKVGAGNAIHLKADRGAISVRKAGAPPRVGEVPPPPAPPRPPKPAKSLADSEVKL